MAIALVSSASGTSTTAGTGVSIAGTLASTAGDSLLAFVVFDNLTASTPTVSSLNKQAGETNNWVRLGQFNSPQASGAAGVRGELWRLDTTTNGPGTTYTATLSASVTAKTITVSRWTGMGTSGTFSAGNTWPHTNPTTSAGTWFLAGGIESNAAPAISSGYTFTGATAGSITANTTGGGAAANVGQRLGYIHNVNSGTANTWTTTDGGWISGIINAAPSVYSASGTATAVSRTSGTLVPDPNAVTIEPLFAVHDYPDSMHVDLITSVPAGAGVLLITSTSSSTAGAVAVNGVIVAGVPYSPVATFGRHNAYLMNPGSGTQTISISYDGTRFSEAMHLWSVSLKDGNLPSVIDYAGNTSSGDTLTILGLDVQGSGATAASLFVSDGAFSEAVANQVPMDTDYSETSSDSYFGFSGEQTATTANATVYLVYSGGGVITADSALAVSLAHVTSGGGGAAAGTSSASSTTTGSLTKQSQLSGTIAVVSASSGAATKSPYSVAGTVVVTSTASGSAVKSPYPASGVVGVVGSASGSATKLTQVSGTLSGVGTSAGTLTLGATISGTVAGSGTVSGDATVQAGPVTHQAAGVVSSSGASSGSITQTHYLWTPGAEVKRNLFPNPRPQNTNYFGSTAGAMTLSNTIMNQWAIRSTRVQAGNYRLLDVMTPFVEQGETYSMWWTFRVTEAMSGIYIYWRPNVTSNVGQVTLWSNGSLPINTIYTFTQQFSTPTGTDLSNSGIVVVNSTSSIGSNFDVSQINIQKRAGTLAQADWFDGDWSDTARFDYQWVGTVRDSASVALEKGQPIAAVSGVYGPPTPGTLLAEYGFNEGTGQSISGSGPGSMTLTGSTMYWGTGVYGSAFGNGTNSTYMWGNSTPGQSELTHMSWLYYRGGSGGQMWWGSSGIVLSNSTVGFRMVPAGGSSFTVNFSYTLPTNQWTHVAVTARKELGTVSLYVNGVLTETKAYAAHAPENGWSPDVFLATESADDWRVFNGVLTQAEIQTYMNTYIGAPLSAEGTVSSTSAVSGDASRGLALGTSSFATGFENDVQPFTTQTQGYAETQVLADGTSWSGGKLLRLSAPGQSHHVQTMPGEYATGTKVSSWVRLGPSATSLAGVALADPNSGNFYVITTDNRNGSGSSANLQIRNGINTTGVATGTAPITISSGIWYRIVGWFDGGFIRAELYDTNGTLQATATHTTPQNGTWTTFRAGVYGYTSASGNYEEYDDFLVGEPTIVSTTSGSVGLASPVTGVVDSVSTVSGVATKLTPATGTVVGVSAVSGVTTLRRAASGTVVAVGTTSGSPTKRTSVQGVVAGVGTTSGTPSMVAVSSGTVSVVSVVSGAPIKRTSVSGAVVGVSVVSGAARLLAVAAGTVVGVSTVAGTAVNTGTQSGTITAVSTVSGVLTARLAVVGAVSGVGTTSGSITSTLPISGTVQAVSVVSGAPYNQTPASGIVGSISTVSGTPTNLAPVSGGPIQGVGATSGAPTSRRPAAGAVVGVSVVSGTPVKRTSAAGTSVTVVSTVSGTPIKRTQASGAAGGVSTTAGSITQGVALSGTVVGVSDVSGEPYKSSGLVGTVIAESTVSGSVVSGSSLLAPSIDGDSTVSGTLTATLVVEGVVDSTGDVSGDLTKTTALSGTVSGLSTVVGTPTKRTRPAGTVTGTSAVSGTLTKRTRPAGSVVVVSTVSGTAAGTFTLSGAVTTESESWGEIQKTTTVSGEVKSVSTVEGELTLSADVSGVVESVSETIGVFNRTRQISGTSVAQSTVSGNATPEGSLAGRVDADTNVTGSITKRAAMSGVVVASSEVSGEFTRQQQLEGVSEAVSILEAYVGADGGAPLILAQVSGLIESISDIVGTLSRGQSVTGRVDAVSSTWATSVLPETLTMMMNGVEFAVTQGMLFLKHNGTEVPVGLGRRSQGAEVVFFEP